MIRHIVWVFLALSAMISTSFAQSTFERLPINSITRIADLPEYATRLYFQSPIESCRPVIKDLVLVKVRYWGFDDQEYQGSLIVHASLGKDVVAIFKQLFKQRFPIQAMYPLPENLKKVPGIYDNVTGSYHCRYITAQPGRMSQHSYGRAIDINPMQNPYIKQCLIVPAGSEKYCSRLYPEPGKILPNSLVTRLFARRGWTWGGNYIELADYMHFEKIAAGEKPNPYGYFGYKLNVCLTKP